MKKIILLIGLLVSPMSHSHDLYEKPISPIMYENVIIPLLREIEPISGVKLPDSMPNVFVASRRAIEKAYCKGEESCNVAAITDDKTGDIILSPALLQLNLFTVSVIFHELVHWAQVKNNMFVETDECVHWAKSEMHAYNAQSKFLMKHGVRGLDVPDLLTQCK